MPEDLEDLQSVANKITKILEKKAVSYMVMLHDNKTGRVLSIGGISGTDKETKRRTYERIIYMMLLTIVGQVIRDLQGGEKDLFTIAFKKLIEDSKKEPVNYIG